MSAIIIVININSSAWSLYIGTLPWRVDISSPTIREYHLQINVTDSLNLTDSAVIKYEGIKSTTYIYQLLL